MKKTIFVVLMVAMVAAPCLAQEVEPEGIFSLHGTEWQALPTGVRLLPFPPSLEPLDWGFGFYGGEVYYEGMYTGRNSFYIDMLACSFFWSAIETCNSTGGCAITRHAGILQPIGIGIVVEWHLFRRKFEYMNIGFLVKTDDNWTPPAVE